MMLMLMLMLMWGLELKAVYFHWLISDAAEDVIISLIYHFSLAPLDLTSLQILTNADQINLGENYWKAPPVAGTASFFFNKNKPNLILVFDAFSLDIIRQNVNNVIFGIICQICRECFVYCYISCSNIWS